MTRLDIYAAELNRWNRAINLVAPKTLAQVWGRHFLDSWQVVDLAGAVDGPWLDLGSGGGFPGLVAAACQPAPVTLVESDGRKSVFLRETARKMGVDVAVRAERIESIEPFVAAMITARALAPLHRLFEYCHEFSGPGTRMLFLKGQDVDGELTEAGKYWKFDVSRHPSQSDPRGVVLSISELQSHG